MTVSRTLRLNSLLKEVISEVIRRDFPHEPINPLSTITRVDISKDLQHAKVYVSVIGTDKEREETILLLTKLAGQIARKTSKKVVMRFFPTLEFFIDDSVDKQMRIEDLLHKIHAEERERGVSQEEKDAGPSN